MPHLECSTKNAQHASVACNLSTEQAEAGGSEILDQPLCYIARPVSKKKKKQKEKGKEG
jgi:hypothetical protein